MRIIPDNRPSIAEYAMLSEHVYHECGAQQDRLTLHGGREIIGWRIHGGDINHIGFFTCGYFARIYRNDATKNLVLSHQGTRKKGTGLPALRDAIMDYKGVYKNQTEEQHIKAIETVKLAIDCANELGYQLTFTGHSLGGYLAELSMSCAAIEYPLSTGGHAIHFRAVTFDSPGCLPYFVNYLKDEEFFETYDEVREFLDQLDTANIV